MTQVGEAWMPSLCSIETQRTSFVRGAPSGRANFGTRKSEMPFVPSRRARQAGEDEVDDVVGEVVLAIGDEDLLAR